MRLLARTGFYYRFTTITGRIVALNLISLIVLVVSMLYINDFRDGLIQTRIKSLQTQADIIARAIAYDGNVQPLAKAERDDPLLGGDYAPPFKISPERATQLLRSLIAPTQTHGFIYNADGTWIADSNKLYKPGQILRYEQPLPRSEEISNIYRLWLRIEALLRSESLPTYKNTGAENGKIFAEVRSALEEDHITPMVRVNEVGETILCVAVPIKRDTPVLGSLLLTTPAGEIDGILARERLSIIKLWALVLAVTTAFSLFLAGTIAGPMHRLAYAAERVRKNIKVRAEIPDFTHRSDEIGHLSAALRDMTSALYRRLDAIESFAADVSHELKNPLTSLRSAADTLSLVKNDDDRNRLVEIILHDVQRLNRLITDISDASRLDAELARESRRPVNIAKLLDGICSIVNDIHREGRPNIELKIHGAPRGSAVSNKTLFMLLGHDSRLSQVVNNLLDNAISFSPPGGRITVTCTHLKRFGEIEITVDDEGPGIPAANLERIFERFYTDRPEHEEFGQNSGLGLNICRQIVEAHNGRIWAENRAAPQLKGGPGKAVKSEILGARFVIRLPALTK